MQKKECYIRNYFNPMFFRAPSVCYEEVFVVKDRQD